MEFVSSTLPCHSASRLNVDPYWVVLMESPACTLKCMSTLLALTESVTVPGCVSVNCQASGLSPAVSGMLRQTLLSSRVK